jgi:hypothetical protein
VPSKRGRDKRRQHVYRKPRDRPGTTFAGSHHCPECGKWCFALRSAAENAAKQAHPGAVMHYYTCESYGVKWWHYTHMTAGQVEGIRAAEALDEPEEKAS